MVLIGALSLDDISALIAIMGHAGAANDASLLRDHLGEELPAIVKLLACATGLLPTPLTEVKVGNELFAGRRLSRRQDGHILDVRSRVSMNKIKYPV